MNEIESLTQRIASAVSGRKRVILELGCGPRKRHKDAIGIDALAYPGVDIISDINDALSAFPSSSVNEVHSYHCLEHLPDLEFIMNQLARVIVPGGILHCVVPHFSNPYFHSDPTHRISFGLYTFSYYASNKLLKRAVPGYMRKFYFDILRLHLGFKSSRPFYGRWLMKKTFGFIFNLHYYLMELYEENFCYLFPCYELECWLKRNENTFAVQIRQDGPKQQA